MVMEENLAKRYVLQVFQDVIGFLMYNAGLIKKTAINLILINKNKTLSTTYLFFPVPLQWTRIRL